LILSDIGLCSVDHRWFELTSLERLDLSVNRLGARHVFCSSFLKIAQLKCLKMLSLKDNQIGRISDELWEALPKSLLHLDLSVNYIAELSPSITQLPNLTKLIVASNRISRLPENVCYFFHQRIPCRTNRS
uniref:Toll-like receptor 7 n=1 Tax=Gongylonema pulchrum TaxID=637853 RepID=A0A183D4F1_9BILA